jgi:hypothetical protein
VGKKKPRRAKEVEERRERLLDEALDQTFPASDPPAITFPHPPQDDVEDDRR